LGSTAVLKAETNMTLFATGNNLAFDGDILRRCLLCNLDSRVERPHERQFRRDPMGAVCGRRQEYVVAILTMLRGYINAGRPNPGTSLAGFESWCRLVRDALVWLGFADPVSSMAAVEATDAKREETAEIFRLWNKYFGAVSAKEAIRTATGRNAGNDDLENPDLHAALAGIAGDRAGGISARRLGKWLAARKGQIVGGKRLTGQSGHDSVMIWRVA